MAKRTTPPAPAECPAAAMMAEGTTDVKGAVAFTGLSRPELYRLMAAGKLAFVKYGKRRLIPRRALVELLAGLVPGLG